MAQRPVLAFDTHAAVVDLMKAGMPERQAESVVRLQATLIERHLATKSDVATVNSAIESGRQEFNDKLEALRQEFNDRLEALRREFNDRLEALRHEVKADIASLKAELIKWMIGTNLAFATLVIAAVKVL